MARADWVGLEESFAFVLNFGWADRYLAGLFSTRLIVIVQPAARRGLPGNTDAAESGAAHDCSRSTEVDEEVSKLARENAALRSSRAKIGAWQEFKNCIDH